MTNKQNKIDKLIEELCPSGVISTKLGDVCKIYDGTHQTPKYTSEGVRFVSVENIKALNKSEKRISQEEYDRLYKIKPKKNDVFMTRIGSIGVCSVIDSDEDMAYYVTLALIRPDLEKVNSRYLKHIIESTHGRRELRKKTLVNATPIKINLGEIGKISIPLPPLKIQEEIANILDKFTQLEAELEAELEARKKQYVHYRNELLTFDQNIRRLRLGDIGKVSMCKRIFKNQTNVVGDIPFFTIGTFGKEPNAFITNDTYDEYKSKYSHPKKGDILLSASGTIGRRVIYDGEPSYFQDSNIIWIDNDETKVLNRFLYYLYGIISWNTEGGTIKRLYNKNITKVKIPVPSIDEQKRIVSTLDKFDSLVNDISIGLPAEINARRKQYEYYRDKLLTFKEYEN